MDCHYHDFGKGKTVSVSLSINYGNCIQVSDKFVLTVGMDTIPHYHHPIQTTLISLHHFE